MSRARDTADQINRVNSSAADATAITVDSSENVLIGTTNANIYSTTTTGINLNPDGATSFNRNGGQAAMFNRINSDGDIVQFRKDGAAVGNIGVNSGDQVYFAASDGMGIKVDTDNTSVEASNASGADNDNAVNLGSSGTRWKDLYLSSGIYLGGTGSSNHLGDYETGNWTPILGGSTSTSGQNYATQHGSYTKIGRVVHLQAYVVVTSIGTTSGTYGQVQNLPFTVAAVQGYGGGFFQYINLLGTNVSQLIAYPEGNSTFAYVLYTAGAGTTTSYLGGGGWGSAPQVMFNMTYLTNS